MIGLEQRRVRHAWSKLPCASCGHPRQLHDRQMDCTHGAPANQCLCEVFIAQNTPEVLFKLDGALVNGARVSLTREGDVVRLTIGAFTQTAAQSCAFYFNESEVHLLSHALHELVIAIRRDTLVIGGIDQPPPVDK